MPCGMVGSTQRHTETLVHIAQNGGVLPDFLAGSIPGSLSCVSPRPTCQGVQYRCGTLMLAWIAWVALQIEFPGLGFFLIAEGANHVCLVCKAGKASRPASLAALVWKLGWYLKFPRGLCSPGN